MQALYNSFKSSGGSPQINENFLADLGKAYKLRYPDDLKEGFNVSLTSIKVLVELDFTVQATRKGFSFQNSSGEQVISRLDKLITDKNQELVEQNAFFGEASRSGAFRGLTHCFELRVLPDGNMISAEYIAGPIEDDGQFDREGLVPK